MQQGREVVLNALAAGDTVYGLTTGLGARSTESLGAGGASEFSLQTLRGRAQSIGPPLPDKVVRAAMLVRLNTMLTGAAGADVEIAKVILACLQSYMSPVVGETGSIGVADLCWGATAGLALCGEGRMRNRLGDVFDATTALAAAGITPLQLGPKDGLVLASHSGFTGAMLALQTVSARILMRSMQVTTAMTMEAMQANLAPLDQVAANLHPQAFQAETAGELCELLEGSALFEAGQAKRLQDPLSIRNAVHVHAAAYYALHAAEEVAVTEINSVTDNPLVDIENGRILSCGTYNTTHVALVVQQLNNALVHVTTAQVARISKILSQKFSGLPQFLAMDRAVSNGFAPLLKIAEALLAEIHHVSSPVTVWPSVNADGVEDIQSNAPLTIRSLGAGIERCQLLCAIELMVSAQAIDMRGLKRVAERVRVNHARVRRHALLLADDRPLSTEIESLAAAVAQGEFVS
nr:histidine ammonia-lyase-like [Nerophis lumbriciformis]